MNLKSLALKPRLRSSWIGAGPIFVRFACFSDPKPFDSLQLGTSGEANILNAYCNTLGNLSPQMTLHYVKQPTRLCLGENHHGPPTLEQHFCHDSSIILWETVERLACLACRIAMTLLKHSQHLAHLPWGRKNNTFLKSMPDVKALQEPSRRCTLASHQLLWTPWWPQTEANSARFLEWKADPGRLIFNTLQ